MPPPNYLILVLSLLIEVVSLPYFRKEWLRGNA